MTGNWSFNYAASSDATAYGAAYWIYDDTHKLLSINDVAESNCVADKAFDASRCSNLYDSDKLQVSAVQVLACIRV